MTLYWPNPPPEVSASMEAEADFVPDRRISAYETTSTSVVGGPVTIPFDAEHVPATGGLVLAGGEVTVGNDGLYAIDWGVTATEFGGGRSSAQFWLEVNTVEVPGSRGMIYIRQNNHGTTCAGSIFLELLQGDAVRVRGTRTNGSGPTVTLANGSRLRIEGR